MIQNGLLGKGGFLVVDKKSSNKLGINNYLKYLKPEFV